ncbi:MAG: hypothetical protein WBD16_16250 [Pyrinomonadaceae bacterium]
MNSVFRKISFFLAIVFAFSISIAAQARFDACLAKDINKGEFVVSGTKKITVNEKLLAIRARCRRGKLVDGRRREIRFFKAECWGNPPADYLEIEQQQQKELARLKKKYTVIEIACGPSVMLTH